MRTRVLAAAALGAALTLAGSVTALEVALGYWDPVSGIGRRAPIQDVEDIPGLEPDGGAEMPAQPSEGSALPPEGEEAEEPTDPVEEPPADSDPPHPSGDTQEPVEQARPVDADMRGIPVHSVAAVGREIVITFDDGPSRYTEEILAILADKQVPAAFFWLAGSSQINLAQKVVAQGHQLGSHTIGHVRLTELTVQEQIVELARSVEILEEAGGGPVQYFRPPYGSYNIDTLEMSKQLNLGMILWNVDSRDWDLADNPHQIIANVMNQVKPGSIILLHERKQTVEILPELLDALRAEGYTFRLLPSMHTQLGPTMQAKAEAGESLELNNEAVPATQMLKGAAPVQPVGEGAAPARATGEGGAPTRAAGEGAASVRSVDEGAASIRAAEEGAVPGATGAGAGSPEPTRQGAQVPGDAGIETAPAAPAGEPHPGLKAEARAELGSEVSKRAKLDQNGWAVLAVRP